MSALGKLLALPAAGPIGALTWLARQIHEAAINELLDPARIETALLALERALEAGKISEAEFEAEEAKLLEELAEIRAARADEDTSDPAELEPDMHATAEAGPWIVT